MTGSFEHNQPVRIFSTAKLNWNHRLLMEHLSSSASIWHAEIGHSGWQLDQTTGGTFCCTIIHFHLQSHEILHGSRTANTCRCTSPALTECKLHHFQAFESAGMKIHQTIPIIPTPRNATSCYTLMPVQMPIQPNLFPLILLPAPPIYVCSNQLIPGCRN
jgi:hypothetical protein